MDLGLRGKVAFVAGASQGLGKAVAMELCREGARVAICGLDDPELPKAVEEIREATGAEIIGVPADVTQAEEAKGFIRKGLEHFGTVDILVNNAGGPPSRTFLEVDDEMWFQGIRLNLMSTIRMTREAVPVMMEKKWGRIINMTSISVKQPIDGLILSNTVRSGVVGLAKTLSNELAPYNITVNNVCPGYTLTERVRSLAAVTAEKEGTTPEEVIARWQSTIPMGRLGTPEEFAALVTFLASERAGYITGASIQIDGGWYKGVM
ncbi:3-oxoacyl-[acyl-carrier protein] reductase [Desulfacinum hydrothermale DSM 13146]|uniref:3-oxoacyl-[acyl-carrier protein] reductase n=1 Tax=Desulfacinum hydrothermale DSM 13146 TaxID=1121390 RepID=A0A1W1X6Z5_9BACT|nr:SDR family oxidoreductase [Desulfacinum hydrothermale]SMC19567.1 3-oxoacyl-[acyl-carrier protein] reductase [Desulfacinum hydrothermale DSM 13146]